MLLPPPPDPAPIADVQLQEVTVLSTVKEDYEQRQQPAAISLLSADQLMAHQVTSLKGASALVPSLYIPDYGSRLTSAIYIRGIGSRINTPAVGLYVDNIPYLDKSAFDFAFLDVERIDVLRGPQGVLYGRNTMGGLIHVYTRNPMRYEGTDVQLSASTGDARRSVSLTHYHRLTDRLACSAGGYYEGRDGFYRHDDSQRHLDAMQAGGGRLRMLYLPTGRLTLDATVSYDYSDEGAYPYYYQGQADAAAGPEPYPDLVGRLTPNRDSRYRRSMLNAGLHAEYHAPSWQLSSVTSYQYLADRMMMDQDFIQPDIYTLEQRQHIHTIGQELTARGDVGQRYSWLLGASLTAQWLHTQAPVTFYADGLRWLESNLTQVLPDASRLGMLARMGFTGMSIQLLGDALLLDGTYRTPMQGLALYHQSSFTLAPSLVATLGFRLDYEHRQMQCSSPAQLDYAFTMLNASNDRMSVRLPQLHSHQAYDDRLSHHQWAFLPKVTLQYRPDERRSVYASVAMGQRSGGYNLQMFGDLLQGALRVDMMSGIRQGVVQYLEQLVASVPNMPNRIPDPDAPGSMVALPDYVSRVMQQQMPQFEVPDVSQVVYQPEYAWLYEVGTHLQSAATRAGQVSVDAALYYSLITDQQIARFVPSGLGRMMVNAGRSHSYGAEVSAGWQPCAHMRVNLSYGYTHAEFLDYDDGQGHDYAHCYVPFVPQHTLSVDAAYTWMLGRHESKARRWAAVQRITLGADCTATGRMYWTEDNQLSQPFYALLGAHIDVAAPGWTLSLWGRNLLDRDYETFRFVSAGRQYSQLGHPRQAGVSLRVHF